MYLTLFDVTERGGGGGKSQRLADGSWRRREEEIGRSAEG